MFISKELVNSETKVETKVFKVIDIIHRPMINKTDFKVGAFISKESPMPVQEWDFNKIDGLLTESQCLDMILNKEF